MTSFELATFRAEVTPPLGHPLCGGWIKPAEGVTDPLYALGIVLRDRKTAPVVLAAVDWCEICGDGHELFRTRLAVAAGTSPERVAVHCVHPHNAPLMDPAAQRLIGKQPGLSDLMDVAWFGQAVDRVAAALGAALNEVQPLTHIGVGQAKVEQVASNRRVMGPDGKVQGVRWSSCKDPALRDAPEGLIDPFLKTVSFWNGDRKLAALHYYATHPMTYYGDGKVTSDFAGLARERRTAEDGGALHVYFTGCGGNITAGKYNDGAPENRPRLSERLHTAMVQSEQHTERFAPDRLDWRMKDVVLPPHQDLNEADLLKTLADPALSEARRKSAALKLTYLRQAEAQASLLVTSLHLSGWLCLLHLPGEPFVEYQLFAQEQYPDGLAAVAGYGDGATGYIPLAQSYEEGGYEPTAAHVAPEAEMPLKEAIVELVSV
ncbi:MAG: hypothetical protein JXR37_10665 [Kiritimatiellae bacterium]|nr:hypothetical protein [Kiritimatiellia bacterium]